MPKLYEYLGLIVMFYANAGLDHRFGQEEPGIALRKLRSIQATAAMAQTMIMASMSREGISVQM